MKGLFDDLGNLYKADYFYNLLKTKRNWISEFSVITKIVSSTSKKIDLSAGKYINIKPERMLFLFVGKNKINIEFATS